MQDNRFDLIDIFTILKRNSRTIWIITGLALIASVIFVLLRPNVYTSNAKVILKSFMVLDKNQLYNEPMYTKEVFAKDLEMDKLMTILDDDDIKSHINEATQFRAKKDFKSDAQAISKIRKNFEIERTDNFDIDAKFTDTDPKLAQAALEAALQKAESMYINFFDQYNREASTELDFKRNSIFDSLAVLSDSIAAVRKTYNLYNQLLPNRGTVISAPQTVSAESAAGIEQLQTLIAVKDKLDEEYAKLTALKNEYSSYLNNDKMHVFYRVSGPYVPTTASNLHPALVIFASTFAGLLFACLLVLMMHAFRSKI